VLPGTHFLYSSAAMAHYNISAKFVAMSAMRPATLLNFKLDIETRRAFCMSGTMSDNSSATLHVHPFHQVLCIHNGITVLEDASRKTPLWGEMAALIPAGVAHRSLVIGDRVLYQCLYFHKALMPDAGNRIAIFKIGELSQALLTQLCRKKNLADLSKGLEGECLALFLKTVSSDRRRRLKRLLLPMPRSKPTLRVVKYIEANFAKRLSLDGIAAQAGYSKRHLERLFVEEMKIAVFEYLSLYRAFRASLALAEGLEKITVIAMDCGYDAPSSFYRDFRKYFGLTPRAFRAGLRQR
jgi:AraC-like DNA-binding protein